MSTRGGAYDRQSAPEAVETHIVEPVRALTTIRVITLVLVVRGSYTSGGAGLDGICDVVA